MSDILQHDEAPPAGPVIVYETRNVLNNGGSIIGSMTLPNTTAEAVWSAILGIYATLPGLPFIPNLLSTLTATATSSVTTSSGTAAIIGGMTETPVAGTYLAFFSGNAFTGGASAQGEFGIYVDGVLITETRRDLKCNLALLGGLVTVSLNQIGVGTYTATQVDLNGTQTLTVQFKSNNGGTIGFAERNFILMRVK